MPATVIINRLNGPYGTPTDVTDTNVRVDLSDAPHTNETTDPVIKPSPGNTNYSFWCTLRLECTVAPDTLIDNLRFFMDGSVDFGTGITIHGNRATSYVMATGGSSSGDELTTGSHAGLIGAPVGIAGYTSGSPCVMDGDTDETGPFGDYIVYQFIITESVSAGASNQEAMYFQYDEN